MIKPDDSLKTQIEKQQKIIAALLYQHEQRQSMAGSPYALFQSAMELESQVRKKTEDLEQALTTIGERNLELQTIYSDLKRDQQSLSETLEVMKQGYVLIKEDHLAVINDQFRSAFPDVANKLYVGARADAFFAAISRSEALVLDAKTDPDAWRNDRIRDLREESSNRVLELKDDRWANMSFQRTSLGNMAIMQSDITDLVRANRAERNQIIGENEILLQAVFEHLSLAICLVSKDGEIKSYNQLFLRTLEISEADFRTLESADEVLAWVGEAKLLKDEVTLDQAKTWYHLLVEGREVRRRLETSSGTILDMKLVALPDDDLIVTFEDVTAETRAKEVLVEAKERLEERVVERAAALMSANRQLKEKAQRQADVERQLVEAKEFAEAANLSKTRFLAAASHDLLQPINAAKLYISTLQDVARSHETRGLAEKISASFDSVESLLQSLLEISRLEGDTARFNTAGFCVGDVLSQIEVDFAPLADLKGLDLRVVGSERWIFSDKTYFRRIIGNLVSNAIEYTESGRVLVGCRSRNGRLRVEVWDTGIGISKEDHKTIFEEFHRVPSEIDTKGIGLGLSIVERATEKLGHKLTMRSELGRGSVFAVEVEAVEHIAADEHREEQVPVQSPTGLEGMIALVIENDAMVRNALTMKLESWGLSVLEAHSTITALKVLAQVGMAPDVVIADYQLDGSDNGFIAIERLRAETSQDLPAIVVTGNQSADLDRMAAAQNVELLRKPVPLRKLRALIDWKTRHIVPQASQVEATAVFGYK